MREHKQAIYTPEVDAKIIELRNKGMTFPEIKTYLGLSQTAHAVGDHYRILNMTSEAKRKRQDRINEWRRWQRGIKPKPTIDANRVQPDERPSPAALAEREFRLNLPKRDLTGSLMGDPPVGFSAYDKKLLEARRDLN